MTYFQTYLIIANIYLATYMSDNKGLILIAGFTFWAFSALCLALGL